MTHTWQIIAFIILVVAAAWAARDKAWPVSLIAAGLAVEFVPAVFQLSS